MNDTLRYMRDDPIHRRFHHNELTFSMIYAFTENFTLPLSHDEVVHGKGSLLDQMPGDLWQKFANLRLLYSYMWTHPGKKLLFMGSDIAQWNEWNCDESLQWHLLQWESHQGIQNLIRDLNRLYREESALYSHEFTPDGFEWIDCQSANDSVLAFIRKGKTAKDLLVVCCNFTPVVRHDHRVGVPHGGWYQEIFNSRLATLRRAAMSGPTPVRWPTRSNGTAGPGRSRSTCHRWESAYSSRNCRADSAPPQRARHDRIRTSARSARPQLSVGGCRAADRGPTRHPAASRNPDTTWTSARGSRVGQAEQPPK